MNRKLQKELQNSFQAPGPERRDEFLMKLRQPREPLYRFVLTQIGYMHKLGWALALLILSGILGLGEYWNGISEYTQFWMVSAFLPFFALAAVLELGRSVQYGMAELESCTRYHLPEIFLVRMGSMGALNLAVLIAAFFFLQSRVSYGMVRTGVYLFLPYVLTCALTLVIQNSCKKRDTGIYCGAAGTFVSLCAAFLPEAAGGLYSGKYFMGWVVILLFACYLLVKQLWRMRKNLEEGLWNLYLTE